MDTMKMALVLLSVITCRVAAIDNAVRLNQSESSMDARSTRLIALEHA